MRTIGRLAAPYVAFVLLTALLTGVLPSMVTGS
jgi:hypothetical protein